MKNNEFMEMKAKAVNYVVTELKRILYESSSGEELIGAIDLFKNMLSHQLMFSD